MVPTVPTGEIEATRFGIELAVRRMVVGGGDSPLVVATVPFGITSAGIVVGGVFEVIPVDGAARIT